MTAEDKSVMKVRFMKLFCTNLHEWFSRTKPRLVRYHEAGKELLSGIEFTMVEPMRTDLITIHVRNDRGHVVLRREPWEDDKEGNNRQLRKDHQEWKAIMERVQSNMAVLFGDLIDCMYKKVCARAMMEKALNVALSNASSSSSAYPDICAMYPNGSLKNIPPDSN